MKARCAHRHRIMHTDNESRRARRNRLCTSIGPLFSLKRVGVAKHKRTQPRSEGEYESQVQTEGREGMSELKTE